MELKDTIRLMESSDDKERFQAEYWQVKIRYEKLKAMLEQHDEGKLNFKLPCPRSVYDMQMKAMTDYLAILEVRADMEHISL